MYSNLLSIMPSRNCIKNFDSRCTYHLYNRGVDKMTIFRDKRDYAVFLSYLKFALLSSDEYYDIKPEKLNHISESQRYNLRRLGLKNRLVLRAFCLMPNHFHLLMYQEDHKAITSFMRSVMTGYAMYFNKRYKRVGPLCQGRFKARHIKTESDLLNVIRYIHLNPVDLPKTDWKSYEPSSGKDYVKITNNEWLDTQYILSMFQDRRSLEQFTDNYINRKNEIAEFYKL